MNRYKSHDTGKFKRKDFAKIGKNVVIEPGVLVFHPENIEIGSNVYIGHNAIIKGYYKNQMVIGTNVWIGQQCFFHSGGGIKIGDDIGIGPGVKILTSAHDLSKDNLGPIIELELKNGPVEIEDGCDIGVGSIILPGVKIGKGTQVGAGSVVTKETKPYSIVAGVPAKLIRYRKKDEK